MKKKLESLFRKLLGSDAKLAATEDAAQRQDDLSAYELEGRILYSATPVDIAEPHPEPVEIVDAFLEDAEALDVAAMSATLPSYELLISNFGNNVTGNGDNWDSNELEKFDDPNFVLGPSTDGTFSQAFDLGAFTTDNLALRDAHAVHHDITLGSGANSFDLKAGDILFNVDGDGTLTGNTTSISPAAGQQDVYVFRPDHVGVYGQGEFHFLVDPPFSGALAGMMLIDKPGGVTLPDGTSFAAGTFVTASDSIFGDFISTYFPTAVGQGVTAGIASPFVASLNDFAIDEKITGLHIVQDAMTLGGFDFFEGDILIALENSDNSVGANGTRVSAHDIALLRYDGSDWIATSVLDGSDVGLGGNNERIDAVTIGIANTAPTSISIDNASVDENSDTSGGLVVGSLSGLDKENNPLTFSVVGPSPFSVVGNDLVLTGVGLDFETTQSYGVKVRATDPGNLYFETDLTIAVNDLVETPPNQAPSVSLANVLPMGAIPEDTVLQTKIADIVVTDDGVGNNILSLSADDADLFEIIGTELFLKANSNLDFEDLDKRQLEVLVEVSDPSLRVTPSATNLWTFENSAQDSIGSANTEVIGTTYIDVDSDVGLSFDGVDDKVKLSSVGYSDEFTISIDFMVDDISGPEIRSIYSHGAVDTANSLNIYMKGAGGTDSPGHLAVSFQDSNDPFDHHIQRSSFDIVGDGQWHNVTLYVSSSVTVAYLDGVAFGGGSFGGDTFNPAGDAVLGSLSNGTLGTFLDGAIGRVEIINGAVDPNLPLPPSDTVFQFVDIADVNEAPSFTLTNQVPALPENSDTTNPIKVADIVIEDDALGTETFNIVGDDSSLFQVIGNELYIVANAALDFETNPSLNVTLQLDDAMLGTTFEASAPFSMNIGDANDAPTIAVISPTDTNLEDTTLVYTHAEMLTLIGGADVDNSNDELDITISNVTNASFTKIGFGDTSVFTFALDVRPENANGYNVTFDFTIADQEPLTATGGPATIVILPVNDEPGVTVGGDLAVEEDSGFHSVANFAVSTPGGAADESGQTFTYSITNDNNSLFSVQPFIDASGTLTYTLNDDVFGNATVTVQSQDSGGTANGGDDLSQTEQFDINVASVNDLPSLVNNNTLTVQSRGTGRITANHLEVTDIDNLPGDIVFNVTSQPGNGNVLLGGFPTLVFTMQDVIDGLVEYQHTGDAVPDAFGFEYYDLEGVQQSEIFNVHISNSFLWFSTITDVSNSGVAELPSWSENEIVQIGDPNLTFGDNSDGTFSTSLDLSDFTDGTVADIDGLHLVRNSHTINSVDLQNGDLLLSTNGDITIDTVEYTQNDIFVFKPNAPGNYGFASGGTFEMVVDNLTSKSEEVKDFALVERDINVGGQSLVAGDLLFNSLGANSDNIMHYDASAGAIGVDPFLVGNDIGLGGRQFRGIELVEETVNINGYTINAGRILATFGSNSSADIGNSGATLMNVQRSDIFELNIVSAGLTTIAEARMFFDGSDVGLGTGEAPRAIALHYNSAPTDIAPDYFDRDEHLDTTGGVSLGVLTATDLDGGDSFTWSIVGGTDMAAFWLGGSGNELFFDENLIDDGVLDFEDRPDYSVDIEVRDSVGNTRVETITLDVNDLNDSPTVSGPILDTHTEDAPGWGH